MSYYENYKIITIHTLKQLYCYCLKRKKNQTNKPNNKQNKQNKRNKTKHKTKQNPKTHFCQNIAYLPGGPWIKEKLEVSAFLMALVWLSL